MFNESIVRGALEVAASGCVQDSKEWADITQALPQSELIAEAFNEVFLSQGFRLAWVLDVLSGRVEAQMQLPPDDLAGAPPDPFQIVSEVVQDLREMNLIREELLIDESGEAEG